MGPTVAITEQPPSPIATETPLPPTATATPSPTATITPTPTPHPLSIEALRSRDHPGGRIELHEVLEPGANYRRLLVSYPSDGLRIFALLTVPHGTPPAGGWPAIVFNHGYIPPDQYRTTERYVAYVDGFARSGYVVFRPDYRGHGDSEGLARGGYSNPDYTIDVLNALASVRQDPRVDANRVGMWGHSMGGFITLRAMVAEQDIRASVIWAGVVGSYPDLLARWRRNQHDVRPTRTPRPWGWRVRLAEINGSPEENPDFWASISANSYLADLSGPVQLHHAPTDDHVPFEFSGTLYQQIQAAGGNAEFYEYPGDNHNLSVYFTLAMQRSIQFFNRHVKGSG